MAKRRAPSDAAHHVGAKRWRWLLIIAACAILLVVVAWVWQTQVEPRWFYNEATQIFEQNPRRAGQLLERAVYQSPRGFPAAQLLWSRALLRTGHRQEALGSFGLIHQPAVLPGEELVILAKEAKAAGENLLAALALEAVSENSTFYDEAQQQLMQLRLEEGRFLDVLALGHKLAQSHRTNAKVTFLMARTQDQLADPLSAFTSYRGALKEPDELDTEALKLALRRSIRLALQLGEFGIARQHLNHLKVLTEPTAEDQLAEAELLRWQGDTEPAMRTVSQLLANEPGNIAALELRGALAFDRQDDHVAEQDFRRVLAAQPWNKGAHYKLAQLLSRNGHASEAELHFKENRRLTELSVRLLALQKQAYDQPELERQRIQELASLYTELGQVGVAAKLLQLAP